jgi:hypothetical protein
MYIVTDTIESRVGYEEDKVDPNARAKIALENKRIDADILKSKSSDRKEQMPYLYRLKSINDVLSGTSEGMAAIIGKPLAYAASRGLEEEGGKDPKKLYAGYVVEDIIPQKNGTYKVVMKIDSKNKDGETVKKTKEFSYTRRNLVSDINQTLNGIGGNANLSNDRILAEFDMFSGTTAAPTTTASSTQAP